MDIKWKKSKAVLGALAFIAGISLLLEGALYFGSTFSSSSGRQWIEDSFQQDFRNTQEFRSYISRHLELFISMGAGEDVYNKGGPRREGGQDGISARRGRIQALHESMKEDKNILYSVGMVWDASDLSETKIMSSGEVYSVVDGEKEYLYDVLYSNSDAMKAHPKPESLPQGYGFLLHFDGEKVHILQDGVELDVYGDGYYRYDGQNTDQWYVPGYENFTVDEAGSHVWVTMAVIDEPQVFIKGSYAQSTTYQYNQLYYIKQNLAGSRAEFIGHQIRMGVGGALFLAYLLLRKSKKRADMALARGTGRLWFEVKLLAAAALVFCCMPRVEYLGDIWQELAYSYADASNAAYAIPGVNINGDTVAQMEERGISYEEWLEISAQLEEQNIDFEEWLEDSDLSYEASIQQEAAVSFGTAVTVLRENAGWLLQEYLRELSGFTANVLAIFWGLYLLIFNDWRYNRRPWRRGVIAMLAAWGLNQPIQKRLSRVCGVTAMTLLLLGAVNLNLLVYCASYRGSAPLSMAWAIITPAALLMLVCAVLIWRLCRLWTDLGAVADQASAVRAGELERESTLQEDSDLYQLADDLNHIRQGLHQAVEERTHSERMKVELVTNVSHDLKTPLTSIISYTELLSQEPLEPPASEYVAILGEKAQRLKAMVQDVFEVSKAASGQLPVKLEQLDYARLLRQTLADMAQSIEDSGLTLRTSIPDREFPITADSDRLYRVFQNLIGNALKYSLPGSRVYLALALDGGDAVASIKNTSATELKPGTDYTARFVRGDESRSDGGSGLGLSIAESFTRACGGALTVTTEADLFTAVVSFPLAE